MKSAFYCLSGVLFLLNSQAQTTVTLQCSKDAAIGYHDGANTSGNNYGSAAQNAAYVIPAYADPSGTNGNRALIDFALNTLPAGAVVLSASLNLYALGPAGSLPGHIGGANTSYIRRVTQSWQEYTATWNNQPPATSVNQVTLPQSSSSTQDYVNVNATSLVQDAVSNPSSSFGFLLILAVEAPSNGLLFCSRENSNPSQRPTLVVTYSTCEMATALSASPSVLCAGDRFFLTATAPGGAPIWYNANHPNLPVAVGTSVQLQAPMVTAPTVISYLVLNSNCTTMPKSAVQLTVEPLPVLVVSAPYTVCAGNAATISVSGASNYSWTSPDGYVGNNPVLVSTINSTTIYTVTGIGANGCRNTATVSVQAVECITTALTEETQPIPLQVYPNPSSGIFYLKNQGDRDLDVEIFDFSGRRVNSVHIKAASVAELSGLPSGSYFFQVGGSHQQFRNKLIIID